MSIGTEELSGVGVGVSACETAVSAGVNVGVSLGTAVLAGDGVGVSVEGAGVRVGVSVVVAVGVELAVGTGVFTKVVKLKVTLCAVIRPAELKVAAK